MKRLAVIPLVLALSGCGASITGPDEPQPELLFTLTPRMAFLTPYSSGVAVLAILRVTDPTPELRCANTVWTWPDGTSGRAEDCIPEELEPWPPGKQRVISMTHIMRVPGEWEIVVELCKWVSDHGECEGRIRKVSAPMTLIADTGEVIQ